ncbi:hypothetical protein HNP03_003786 [Pseudomonas rhodesiae]|jgi:hypothetical protein|nr:hypothetical protein [Pseudomonas rhodesiae]
MGLIRIRWVILSLLTEGGELCMPPQKDLTQVTMAYN